MNSKQGCHDPESQAIRSNQLRLSANFTVTLPMLLLIQLDHYPCCRERR
jgi:hypothetical protein